MLTQPELNAALVQGQRGANRCTRFCVVAGRVEDGKYACWHNGVGDASEQFVHADVALNQTSEQFAAWVMAWIDAVHGRTKKYDLNTGRLT